MIWMMEHATDIGLLRRYTEHGSEEAFATLVWRYVDLVYSTAWRQVQDETMAEEVTQARFIVLARKAQLLNDQTILSAWLYRTARFAAAAARKLRMRRMKHKQELARMDPPEADTMWLEIEPLLDDATNVAASLHAETPMQVRFNNAMASVVRSEGALRKAPEDKSTKAICFGALKPRNR